METPVFNKRIKLISLKAVLIGIGERESGNASQLYESHGAANIMFDNETYYKAFLSELERAVKDGYLAPGDFWAVD